MGSYFWGFLHNQIISYLQELLYIVSTLNAKNSNTSAIILITKTKIRFKCYKIYHFTIRSIPTELTEMSWYEWFIMAMRRLSNTIILMTENDPNMSRPKNRVNSLIPVNSKLSKSTSPKMAQNNVCEVSHRLIMVIVNIRI